MFWQEALMPKFISVVPVFTVFFFLVNSCFLLSLCFLFLLNSIHCVSDYSPPVDKPASLYLFPARSLTLLVIVLYPAEFCFCILQFWIPARKLLPGSAFSLVLVQWKVIYFHPPACQPALGFLHTILTKTCLEKRVQWKHFQHCFAASCSLQHLVWL